jgi:hypothetical protein
VAAEQRRVDRYSLPYGEVCDARPDRNHLTGEFVTWDDRIRCRWEVSVDDMQIGTADAHRLWRDDDLAEPRRWVWYRLDAELN